MTVYLLHFSGKVSHAQHYIGTTDNLATRIERHKAGNGSKLVAAAVAMGLDVEVVRTWEGDHVLERQLKDRKAAPRLCPICKAAKNANGT